MEIIKKLVDEFNKCDDAFSEAIANNLFHEASDIKSYMLGITRAMIIALNTYPNYTQEDRQAVDECINVIDRIYNVFQDGEL